MIWRFDAVSRTVDGPAATSHWAVHAGRVGAAHPAGIRLGTSGSIFTKRPGGANPSYKFGIISANRAAGPGFRCARFGAVAGVRLVILGHEPRADSAGPNKRRCDVTAGR